MWPPRDEFSWNAVSPTDSWPVPPRVVDETFRDGLQSPSAHDPPLDRKLAALHAMVEVGVEYVSVGLPAAGARAVHDAVALAREISSARLPLRPTAAARTTEGDVRAIAEVSQRAGVSVDVYAFLGCSPLRRYVEGWSSAWLFERIHAAGEVARKEGLTFCLVMEDTTRTPPAALREVFAEAVSVGASRLCLCDTVGHADPHGAAALVTFALDTLRALGAPAVTLDWHGHNDRGLALGNALAAARAGVRAVHATSRGVGERAGNVPMELLLAQLAAAGARGPVRPAAIESYRRLCSLGADAPTQTPTDGAFARVKMSVNGDPVELALRPDRTLLEVLRDDLDLIGTKRGCDAGECGACTVLVDGGAVLACLTLAAACDGRAITTVESLSGAPALDPLLDAFDREGAGQCGFCTPGMLMTARALLAREPRPSRERIREAISGNLCRCTGYRPIVAAIERASRGADGCAGCDAPLPRPLKPHDERAR